MDQYKGSKGAKLEAHIRGMEFLREIDPELLGTAGVILFYVALHPNTSMSDLEKHHKFVTRQALYRQLATLTDNKGKGVPGLELVEAKDDPMDRRIRQVNLTDKGHEVVTNFLAVVS